MGEVRQQVEREDLWGYLKRLRFVRNAISESYPNRVPGSLRILDVGCGNGTQLAMPLIKEGYLLTGVDTDTNSIEHARRLAVGYDNAKFLCQRVDELNRSEAFDIVILSEVLEHTKDPLALLKEGVERLASKGIMIVTVPNGYGEFELDSWLFRTFRLQRLIEFFAPNSVTAVGSTDNDENGHVQFFTRGRLEDLFESAGLKIVREAASSLFSGPIAGHTLGRSNRFIEWNARAADKLPASFSSGWFYALWRKE